MEGELDPFTFTLAEALGKTLGEIGAMPNRDYIAWRAFYTYRTAMAEMGK